MTKLRNPTAGRLMMPGLLLSIASTGFGAGIPAGEIVARVECEANPAYSYALYLPRNYDPARKWPVLYCFDPAARGTIPVRVFRDAADTFGYIVAGSNDSRNGPLESATIEAMIEDIRYRWSIDPQRVYAAGFSGGARVASRVGMAGLVSGVVACGAGFPEGPMPDRVRFDFFGAAGRDDFNREEMEQLDTQLQSRGAAHHLELFHGGHEWMPSKLAVAAIAWLEEQHKHSGIRARYDMFIELSHRNRSVVVAAMPPSDAWLECQRLIADFDRLADVSACKRRVHELQRYPEVRTTLPQLRASAQRYREMQEKFLSCVREGDVAALQGLIAEWKTAAVPSDQKITERVLEGVLARVLAGARDRLARNDYHSCPAWLIAATLIVPGNVMIRYDLVCVHALAGDGESAVASLEQAVALGFDDFGRMDREAALASLRDNPAFSAKLSDLAAARRDQTSSN